jgi:hypothetical protein
VSFINSNLRLPLLCNKDNFYCLLLKISGHQQRWPGPLPGAILIPPALLVVADWLIWNNKQMPNPDKPELKIED